MKRLYIGLMARAAYAGSAIRNTYLKYGRKIGYALYRRTIVHLAELSQYHLPMLELGIYAGNPVTAGKGNTSRIKWELISNTLPANVSSALDVGCYNGFFSLRLARRGIFTIAIDPDEDLLRLAQLSALEAKVERVAFSTMKVDPNNIHLLPEVDVTLVLSVMHRWVGLYGHAAAFEMLRTLWANTRASMYFEIPNPCQNSIQASVLAYMGKSESECEQFIQDMLESLGSCEVTLLGYLPTDFRPNESRHFFSIRRKAGSG